MLDILNAFVGSFFQIFESVTLTLMLIGIAAGFAVGILPGLGGPTTLALMLPFIFTMKPVEAFAFLLGMASVVFTTGDITSILFGIPGEPTTAATIVDGHPMAKKGEAGRALGAALMSSLIGAIFGAFSLALAIPFIRPIVLAFGSPEFFMLALLGITFVAALSGEAPIKGLIAGGIGLMLATVGLDPVSGIERYTFGRLFLWDGIGLVPVTIGLFAIPEIIEMAVQQSSIARQDVGRLGGVMEGIKDTFRHWRLVIRCSAIGTYAGIIPGMGGAVSQWLAYAHAQQTSKNPEQFGKGCVEGVLAPGAANNSTLGGNMIPATVFGVPASVMTAILLGAFIIHGIVPGPDMLIPEAKGGRLMLTFSFVWIIALSNLITVALCLLFLKPLVKLTQIRGSLLMPFILLLIYLGAYAEKNAFEDLLIVLAFGLLGWLMVVFDYQRPPLLMGLVLGPLAENRLFISMDNFGSGWMSRPGVLVILSVILIGLIYPRLKKKRRRAQARNLENASTLQQEPAEPESPTNLWAAARKPHFGILFLGVIIALQAGALWESTDFDFHSGLFPWTLGAVLMLLALFQLGTELLGLKKRGRETDASQLPAELTQAQVYSRTAKICAWNIGYCVAVWLFGFSLSIALITFLYLKLDARENWGLSVILTSAAWIFFYGLFDYLLHIPFPPGLLLS
jgi:putative tricarboxylic transport membrane protein